MKKITVFLILIFSFLTYGCQNTVDDVTTENTLQVQDLAWQDDKYLWASTYKQLLRWDTQTKEKEIFKDYSGELFVDTENVLWVFDRGIVRRFDGQNWEHFSTGEELVSGSINSFVEADGYIWVSTYGLSRYSQETQTWEILLDDLPGPVPTPIPTPVNENEIVEVEILIPGTYSIAPVSRDVAWVGTSRGLTYWEHDYQETWGNRILDTDGVRCLLKATHDTVWVCTEHGMGRWDGNELKDFLKGWNERPPHFVESQEGDIWTTSGEGVSRWDGQTWTTWTNSEEINLPLNTYAQVGELLVSSTDANIWIIVKDGIGRWDGGKWRTYMAEDGLTVEYIDVLMQDSRGIVWVGGRYGINYYDPDADKWYPFP
jgi:ligand-binding sensor domain-containing protein